MTDRTCVLRFLAFYEKGWDTGRASFKAFLDKFYKDSKDLKEEKATKYEEAFLKALEACEIVFGNRPFKIKKEGSKDIHLGLFQYTTVCFKKYALEKIREKKDAIREAHKKLMEERHKVIRKTPKKSMKKEDTYKDISWTDIIKADNATDIRYAFNTWQERLDKVMEEGDVPDF